jgi:hypothetical protein
MQYGYLFIIRSLKSKDRHRNGQQITMVKTKTNSDMQNTTQKMKDKGTVKTG